MAAGRYVDVLVTLNKGKGLVEITTMSNRQKLFQLEHEDSEHKRVLISTVPEGQIGKSMERTVETAHCISLRLRRRQPRRDRWGRFSQ